MTRHPRTRRRRRRHPEPDSSGCRAADVFDGLKDVTPVRPAAKPVTWSAGGPDPSQRPEMPLNEHEINFIRALARWKSRLDRAEIAKLQSPRQRGGPTDGRTWQ